MSAPSTPPPLERSRVAPRDEGVAAAASALLGTAADQARHIGELAAAETRLAAQSAVLMLVLGVLAAVALLTTWLLLLVLAVDGLTRLGLAWQLAVALLAAVQLLAAYGLWRGAVGLSENLVMPRLRRTLFAVGGSR